MPGFAVVVRVEAGRVNLVRSNEVFASGPLVSPPHLTQTLSDATILSELERARTAYPTLTGDVRLGKPRATIHWATQQRKECEIPSRFDVAFDGLDGSGVAQQPTQ